MRKTPLAALILAATIQAKAQTISDVLGSVEQNNMELKALLKGNEAADLETRQQNNLEGLSVEYSPFFNKDESGIASSELIVSQGFDFPTLYGARKKAARLQRNVREMEYETARRDILLAAKNLCLDLIHCNKQEKILAERRRNADEMMAMFTEKYNGGEGTALELNKIKMERMNLETELAEAKAARSEALRGLQALNGGKEIDVTMTDYPALPTDSYMEMYEQAVTSDHGMMTAEAAVRAAEQDVKVNKQGWLPQIEIGYRRNTEGNDASHGFLIGGSIPIFANKNKVKQAKARKAEAEMQQAEARIKAESSARAMVEKMQQLHAAAKTYDVKLMYETLELLKKAVENGELSVTDYYTEADEIYLNILSFLNVERQYQGVVADITKNSL